MLVSLNIKFIRRDQKQHRYGRACRASPTFLVEPDNLYQETLTRFSIYHASFVYFKSLRGPGRVAQSVGHLTRKSGVLGSIPGLATYFRFSFRFFKKGSCQLLAKVCARSTG